MENCGKCIARTETKKIEMIKNNKTQRSDSVKGGRKRISDEWMRTKLTRMRQIKR